MDEAIFYPRTFPNSAGELPSTLGGPWWTAGHRRQTLGEDRGCSWMRLLVVGQGGERAGKVQGKGGKVSIDQSSSFSR